jgi:hypothetical protein
MLQALLRYFRAIELSENLNWLRNLFIEILNELSHLRTRKDDLYIFLVVLR